MTESDYCKTISLAAVRCAISSLSEANIYDQDEFYEQFRSITIGLYALEKELSKSVKISPPRERPTK